MSNEASRPNSKPTEQFETDSQRIVRRHLENENDIITDEDLRNVRIGMTPGTDEPTEDKMESLIEEVESEKKSTDDNGIDSNDNPITRWDAVQR